MRFAKLSDKPAAGANGLDLNEFFSDPRWKVVGDLIPDAIILVDFSGTIRYLNAAAESVNEIDRAMLTGRPLADLVKSSRINCSMLPDAFMDGKRLTLVVGTEGGGDILVSTRFVRKRAGEIDCFVIIQQNLEKLNKLSKPRGNINSLEASAGGTSGTFDYTDLIVSGEDFTQLVKRGMNALSMGSRMLLLGESGVGKSSLAKFLHQRSGPVTRPFVHVNCGSIPESLFESEMFGYERGSFTGASVGGKKGLIEAADGGILFLDEVGEIPLLCQAKILQFLETGMLQKVGSTASKKLNVKVISATNRDLKTMIAEGKFRMDLFYRLAVVAFTVPPLRERRDLIPPLLDRFLTEMNARRPSPLILDQACRNRLYEYSYPGNVRQLQNVVEYLAVVCDGLAGVTDLPDELKEVSLLSMPHRSLQSTDDIAVPHDLRAAVKQFEANLIDGAIQRTGSKRKAAELLCVDIATIVRKSR